METLSPARLLLELRVLAERYPQVRMSAAGLAVPTFELTLELGGASHPLRLTLPPGYPALPPDIRELDAPGGAVRTARGAMHRLAGGALCLFTHGNDPQAWHPGRCAADALDRCAELLRREQESAGDRVSLFRGATRLIISPGAAQVLRISGGFGTLSLVRAGKDAGDVFVAMSCEESSGLQVPGLAPCWTALMKPCGTLVWVRVGAGGGAWREHLRDASTLRCFLAAALPEPLARRAQVGESLVLVPDDQDGAAAWLIEHPAWSIGAVYLSEVMISDPDALLFHRVDGALARREALAGMRIVLIGLGSLGSAVAVALARSGFQRFVLIDPERLSLENVSRHIGTTRELGERKVDVVASAIVAINPHAEVERIPRWLAWDIPAFGAGAEFVELLDRPGKTLVITTCAVGRVERQINALAVRRGVPAMYATALGSAEHGRVFRVIAGESACYECVRLAQIQRPDRYPQFDTEAGAAAYSDPSLPGLAIDIGQVALVTARFVVQTAARVGELDVGFPDEIGDHLLWTNRGGWGFDRPLQIEVERVPRALDCPVCGDGAPAATLTDDETAELAALAGRLRSSADGCDR